MSLSFRNLVLIGLLVAIVSSVSISSHAHQRYNNHMLRVHEAAQHEISHQANVDTDASTFVSNIQNIIQTIQGSVQGGSSIIDTKNLPTFAFSKSTCEKLSDDQRNQLLNQVNTTRTSVTSFRKNANGDKLKADADNSLSYLNTIERLVKSKCQDISYLLIGPTPYQTNVNTRKSWILGGVTFDDLVKDYTNRITNNNNVTNCGENTPFWTGFSCISCSDPNPIFNIATGKCTTCPSGTEYNFDTKTCAPSARKNYKPHPSAQPDVLVPTGAPADALSKYMNTGDVECPKTAPFVKDNTCIPCPTERPYFNLIAKECQNCPENFVFDSRKNNCIKGTPNITDVPTYNPRLVMNDNSTQDDWTKYENQNTRGIFCPDDKPFWTKTECIQCPELFNVITRKCMACEPGFSLHTDTHKCQPASPLEPSLKDLFNAIF